MHKILAMAVSLAMLLTLVPAVDASETKTAIYDVPSGPIRVAVAGQERGSAVSTRLCAPEWDQWDADDEWEDLLIGPNETYGTPGDGLDFVGEAAWDNSVGNACPAGREARDRPDDGVVNFGIFSAGIQADEDAYTNFVVSINDDSFDSTFFSGCIYYEEEVPHSLCRDPTIESASRDVTFSGCGSSTVTTDFNAGGPVNGPAAFVYGSYLNGDTLETCFGSSGSLTLVMS